MDMDGPPFLEVWRCSVVVIHFINYQEVASKVPARDLACWLHSLYCKLDVVVQKHEAHKVSTAQELYVAVLQEHHGHNTAVAAVGLALELLDAVQELKLPSGAPLFCRVAVSTGKAAAAITGTAAWSFQLYGKTLEKAKAVVQSGPVGVLQLTGDVVGALPDPASFTRHRCQPEFGGLAVYLQAPPQSEAQIQGAPHDSLATSWRSLAAGACSLSRATSAGALRAARSCRAAACRLQFQDASLEAQFRRAWNTKLYQQDLWALAILTPLSLVACLVLPTSGNLAYLTAMSAAYLWATSLLTALLALVWSYKPSFYIRRRFVLLTLYRAVRVVLFSMLRNANASPTFNSLQSIIPHGVLLLNTMTVSVQVQFDYQAPLHLLAYLLTMGEVFTACKQQDASSPMPQCMLVGAVVCAWFNFVAGVVIPLAACSVMERSARLAFLTSSKAHSHYKAA